MHRHNSNWLESGFKETKIMRALPADPLIYFFGDYKKMKKIVVHGLLHKFRRCHAILVKIKVITGAFPLVLKILISHLSKHRLANMLVLPVDLCVL